MNILFESNFREFLFWTTGVVMCLACFDCRSLFLGTVWKPFVRESSKELVFSSSIFAALGDGGGWRCEARRSRR